MISKGMPGTIDLTDNRDFRQGVERVGHIGNPATPGKVPWDSRGYEYPQNAERYHEIRRTLNMSFEYTTSTSTNTWVEFSNIDASDSFDTWYTDSDCKYINYQYNFMSVERVVLTTDPESIIPHLKNFEFDVTNSGVYIRNTSSANIHIGGPNVTPDILKFGTLSEDEFNDKVMLTGKGLALRDKIALYRYLKAVQKIIDEYNKTHRDFDMCEWCKTPIVLPCTRPDMKYAKFCWKCANKIMPHKFALSRMPHHLHTVDLIKCKMRGRTTLLRDIYRRNITYAHPFYMDRGLSLISNGGNRLREAYPRNVAQGYAVVTDLFSILEHL